MVADPKVYDTADAVLALGGMLDLEDIQGATIAAGVSYDDSGHGTIVAGANVQAALVSVADEFTTPVHTHAGGGLFAEIALAADQSLTTSQVATTFVSGTVVDNSIIEFEAVCYFTGVTNGQSVVVSLSGVDGGIVYEDEGTVNGGIGTSVVGDHTSVFDSASAGASPQVIKLTGRVVANGTAGLVLLVGKDVGANGVLAKGSYFKFKNHSA